MPVLPMEPIVYPETLLAESGDRPAGQWWLLHTRPRAEKSVARRLKSREIGFFLPLYGKALDSRNGQCAHHPLFPGYVFLHGNSAARSTALETGLLVGCIPVSDQERLWTDLEGVHRLIGAEGELRAEWKPQPGEAVEIVAGPLCGLRGKWIRHGGQGRFLVDVQLLSQGVSVEIDEWMVQGV